MLATPDSGAGNTLGLAVAALGDRVTKRTRAALTTYLIVATGAKTVQGLVRKTLDECAFTISVSAEEDLYPELATWLLERIPERRQRSLAARTTRNRSNEYAAVSPDVDEPTAPPLLLFYDGHRTQKLRIDGHRVAVSVEYEELSRPPSLGSPSEAQSVWKMRLERIVFRASNQAGRDAVLSVLRMLAARQARKRQVRTLVGNRYGGWTRQADMPLRRLETVVLGAGQKEAIVDDLAEFLSQEQAYGDLGIPWHRGYFFSGPPGTGKTSFARALAVHFGLDVHFVALSSLDSDAVLIALMNELPPRTMLLLEDIDVLRAAGKRSDDAPGVTLAGLLNCLDGLVTPHGLVMVMTANDRDVLDAALVRPGRIDRNLTLGPVDDEQLQTLVEFGTGLAVGRMLPPLGGRVLSPAAVVDVLKSHLGKPEDAVAAVAALIAATPVKR